MKARCLKSVISVLALLGRAVQKLPLMATTVAAGLYAYGLLVAVFLVAGVTDRNRFWTVVVPCLAAGSLIIERLLLGGRAKQAQREERRS